MSMYNSDGMSVVAVGILGVVALGVVAGAFYGFPKYNVYAQRLHGEAELARAQGNRLALVAQAGAEEEAAVKRAEATARRVAGWVKAAKEGCQSLGRSGPELKACEDMLIRESLTFSIAHEGNEGVTIVVGTSPNVAIPANRAGEAR